MCYQILPACAVMNVWGTVRRIDSCAKKELKGNSTQLRSELLWKSDDSSLIF